MKISAQQLEDFAAKEPARSLLPELVRRLITATADRIEDVRFPSGESTFRPGADGLVQAIGKPPYIPDGVSLWELSTEKRPHGKARKDIKKRSASEAKNEYLGTARSDITYVALTLRRWHGEKRKDRDDFEAEQCALGIWKQVRVIDADDLETWLDGSPSVRAWLARKMQLVSEDMKDIDAFWDDYRQDITPLLSEQLLLLNREAMTESLFETGLNGGVTRVKADSPNEAAAFVAAAILSLPKEEPRRNALLAKGLVITKPEAEIYLTDSKQQLLVIALGRAAEMASRLTARGHTVITAYGTSHSSSGVNSPLLELPRPRREAFAEELQKMGMQAAEARRVAGECHCSITVLYRIGDQAHFRRPDWATAPQLRKLVGPISCGAWLHNSEADKQVLADVAGKPYDQVEDDVIDVLLMDDAPVLRAGGLTSLSAPADIWQLSIEHQVITKPLLDRFRSSAIVVLGERDPALELAPEERVYAELNGKIRKHSAALRRGVSEILRLIAINEQNLAYIGNGFSAQHFVDDILQDIPGLASDYRALASLDSLLPDLAEAAALPFLSALEKLMAGDGTLLSPIFEGSDDTMFGRTYYLGTLRGLEVLAWDPVHLVRATQILARMAELDPGGRLINRPINSLAHIFLPWNPNTNASAQARHHALEQVCEHHPSIAWTLLTKLLPENHAISFGTSKPEWRESGASSRPVPTYGSVGRDYEFVVQTALPLAGAEAGKWIELIKAAATSWNEPQLTMMLERVAGMHDAFVAEQQDQVLWEALEALAAKHRAFATAKWAMPETMIQKIEQCSEQFKPTDPIVRYRHLFDHSLIERSDPNESYEERQERTSGERDAAITEISKKGVEPVVRLALQAKTAGLMAQPIIRATGRLFCRNFVLATFDGDERIAWLSALVLGSGSAYFGLDWAMETIDELQARGASAKQVAPLLSTWDDTRELFDFVTSKPIEIQEEYWRIRDIFVRSGDEDLVEEVVGELIEHGRSAELIGFLGGRLDKTDSATLLRVLTRAFEDVISEPERLRRVDDYWLRMIFEELRKREDADRDILMGLEYRWFPALHSHTQPQVFALHDYMAENPEFFVEVLSDLYRANSEIEDEQEEATADLSEDEETAEEQAQAPDAEARGKAEIAHKLLESWQTLPWLKDDSSIDYSRMLGWIQKVLDLSKKVGRYEVASGEIGKLLAYAPDDSTDGVWPAREIRDLIETLANSQMESSIVVELFNKRGVHTRSIEGGGDQERVLAEKAMYAAGLVQDKWPRTAGMLRDNAKQWTHHAEWEDRKAAERRISL